MNFNGLLVFCLGFVLWSDSCDMSFPRGAWAAEACEKEITGTVESATMSSSGEAVSLVVERTILNLEPGNFKADVLQELVGETLTFYFHDRRCRNSSHDKVVKIVGQYQGGVKDISRAFLNPEVSGRR